MKNVFYTLLLLIFAVSCRSAGPDDTSEISAETQAAGDYWAAPMKNTLDVVAEVMPVFKAKPETTKIIKNMALEMQILFDESRLAYEKSENPQEYALEYLTKVDEQFSVNIQALGVLQQEYAVEDPENPLVLVFDDAQIVSKDEQKFFQMKQNILNSQNSINKKLLGHALFGHKKLEPALKAALNDVKKKIAKVIELKPKSNMSSANALGDLIDSIEIAHNAFSKANLSSFNKDLEPQYHSALEAWGEAIPVFNQSPYITAGMEAIKWSIKVGGGGQIPSEFEVPTKTEAKAETKKPAEEAKTVNPIDSEQD